MNYISVSDVNVKPVADSISRAGWTNDDINRVIVEAENYVESALVKLGYTRDQLKNNSFIKVLMVKYSWYAVMRDIYTQNAPSFGKQGGEEYKKWREFVDEILTKFIENKIKLLDDDGQVIVPANTDMRYYVNLNTKEVVRSITMGDDFNWSIDDNYSSDKVIGEK